MDSTLPTSFFSLSAELRNIIYHYYASSQKPPDVLTVVGNRFIPPPLVYASRAIQEEFWPIWNEAKPNVFRPVKKLRAVVVDLDFGPLLDYIWALDDKAPLLSKRGEISLLVVFTEASLAMDRATGMERKRLMLVWTDWLAAMRLDERHAEEKGDLKPGRRLYFQWSSAVLLSPPDLQFEKSRLLDALAGSMAETPQFAEMRTAKAKVAKERYGELRATGRQD